MRIATIGGLRVLILQNVRNESLTRVIIFILLHRQGKCSQPERNLKKQTFQKSLVLIDFNCRWRFKKNVEVRVGLEMFVLDFYHQHHYIFEAISKFHTDLTICK